MKKSRAPVPTIDHIEALYNSGDIEALRALNETLAKRSNQGLSELEKYSFDTTAAYKRAQDFIGESDYSKNNRFSRSKKIDAESLYDQVIQEANFLRWQTSTVAGEQKRRDEIFDSLFQQHISEETGEIVNPPLDLPTDMDIDTFKKHFLDFLDTDAWEELKKHIYHKNILNEAGEAISAGASIADLEKAMRDYSENNTKDDLLTIWDKWTAVEK